jgi:uncharacterized membrane protein
MDPTDTMPAHVHRGIETVAAIHAHGEQDVSRHQRFVERATHHIGRPRSLYVIVAAAFSWGAWNTIACHFGVGCVDPPPFFWMQGVVGFAALLVATMVLTTQNRHGVIAERRAHLDLEVNLLAEQKVAKLIQLIEELRTDLPNVRDRVDPVAREMQEQLDAHAVANALERTLVPREEPTPNEDGDDDG